MSKDEKIVMFDSPDAATYRTDIKGWVSRTGQFYGDGPGAERGARWAGCTHEVCPCGNTHDKSRIICDSCYAKKQTEKYYSLPVVDWDETTPVCEFQNDKFFFDVESLLDEMYWQLEEAKKRQEEPEMQIVLCEPHYLHLLDGDEWSDDIPDEGDGLSEEVGAAIDALNAVLKTQGPSCWYPGKVRINMEPLWERIKTDLEKEKNDEAKA